MYEGRSAGAYGINWLGTCCGCGAWIAPCDGDDAGTGDGAREGCIDICAKGGGTGEDTPETWPEDERGSGVYTRFGGGAGSIMLEIAGDALAR